MTKATVAWVGMEIVLFATGAELIDDERNPPPVDPSGRLQGDDWHTATSERARITLGGGICMAGVAAFLVAASRGKRGEHPDQVSN